MALHCAQSEELNSDTLAAWAPRIEANLDRLGASVRRRLHVDNLARWRDMVEARDVEVLRAVMVAADTDGIALREVPPLNGLLSEGARLGRWGSTTFE